jgi:hypothetical protein
MQHQHFEGSRTGRKVFRFPFFVMLIAVPFLAAAALVLLCQVYLNFSNPAV